MVKRTRIKRRSKSRKTRMNRPSKSRKTRMNRPASRQLRKLRKGGAEARDRERHPLSRAAAAQPPPGRAGRSVPGGWSGSIFFHDEDIKKILDVRGSSLVISADEQLHTVEEVKEKIKSHMDFPARPGLQELRAELEAMGKLNDVKKRAKGVGVEEAKLEAAHDADDVKAAVIDLILAQVAAARWGFDQYQLLKAGSPMSGPLKKYNVRNGEALSFRKPRPTMELEPPRERPSFYVGQEVTYMSAMYDSWEPAQVKKINADDGKVDLWLIRRGHIRERANPRLIIPMEKTLQQFADEFRGVVGQEVRYLSIGTGKVVEVGATLDSINKDGTVNLINFKDRIKRDGREIDPRRIRR